MKLFSIAVLVLVNNAVMSSAQFTTMMKTFAGSSNLEATVAALKAGEPVDACSDEDVIKCFNLPDDIDDTEFIVDPTIPAGTTLGMLKGFETYDLVKGKVEAYRDVTLSCDDLDVFHSVTYPWIAQAAATTAEATGLTYNFLMPGDEAASVFLGSSERVVCGTEAIVSKTMAPASAVSFVPDENSPIVDLVGKQVVHTWDQNGGKFVSSFCDESTFTWNDLSMPDVVTATEVYVKTILSNDTVMYSWKEPAPPVGRDFGLTWIFNFSTMTVYGVIVNVFPDSNLNLSGPFEIVDGLTVPEGLTPCASQL